MSLKFFSNRLLIAGVLASAVGLAVAQTPKPDVKPDAKPDVKPDTKPDTPAGPTVVNMPPYVFVVNGKQMSTSDFIQALYQIAGPRVLEEALDFYAARAACDLAEIKVGEPEFKAEIDTLIKAVYQNMTDNNVKPEKEMKDLTDKERAGIVAQVGQSQGKTYFEMNWMLQERAYLRALGKQAKDEHGALAVSISDTDVNDEFTRQNSEKADVIIYIFQDIDAAQKVIAAAGKDGKTFPQAAAQSQAQASRVTIPLEKEAKFEPAAFKDTVKQVKEHDTSAVLPYTDPTTKKETFLVFYVNGLSKHITVAPDKIVSEKAKLKDRMLDGAQLDQGSKIVNDLRQRGNIQIDVKDPILQGIYQAAEMQRQQAATRGGAATATAPATTMPGH